MALSLKRGQVLYLEESAGRGHASGVKVVERSENRKLSAPISAGKLGMSCTMVSQASCDRRCAFFGDGCYAEVGKTGIHTALLNASAETRSAVLARREAAGIRALSGWRKLRAHVVGDCKTEVAAGLVGAAMVAHERKHGRAAWTYTHSWQWVRRAAWAGARVFASCEKVSQVARARARGYAVALVVPVRHPSRQVYQYQGLSVLPCPAQFSTVRSDGSTVQGTHCEDCSICSRPDELIKRGLVLGFQPDKGSKPRCLGV